MFQLVYSFFSAQILDKLDRGLDRRDFGKAMSNSPPVRDIKVTIGEHAFRFEGRFETRPGDTPKLTYKATAESQGEFTRTFGDFQMIITIAPKRADATKNNGGYSVCRRVWEISDETSRSLEDMLLGFVGKTWQVVNSTREDVKALHKSAMRVDFWVEPQEERPWKRRKFTDAELVCGDESFEVHRGLLAAKSEVFEAAFESAFQEGVRAKYEIKDASKAAVKGTLAKKIKTVKG